MPVMTMFLLKSRLCLCYFRLIKPKISSFVDLHLYIYTNIFWPSNAVLLCIVSPTNITSLSSEGEKETMRCDGTPASATVQKNTR